MAVEFDVKVEFCNIWDRGECYVTQRRIVISTFEQTPEEMLCTFFHELGHIECSNRKIWTVYNTLPFSNMSKSDKSSYIRTALKAERWIDKWASKKIKEYFPTINYTLTYFESEGVEYMKDHLKEFKKLSL